MMDKAKRQDMLKALMDGGMTVPEAVEKYGVSERHVRRLLSTARRGSAPRMVHDKPFPPTPEASAAPSTADISDALKGPEASPGAAAPPPSASEIDAALRGEGDPEAPPAPDAVPTADLAVQGMQLMKMAMVLLTADAMEIPPHQEKKVMELTKLHPFTESVLRSQKPESLAKLGDLAASPWAIPLAVVVEGIFVAIALRKLAPVKEKKDGE